MTLMFAVSMSAQKHVLRVWRGGEKLFETKIEENDSITFTKLQGQDYSYELPDTFKTFTYDGWRKQEQIYLFITEGSGGRWFPTALPWRASSTTAIFDEYRRPNKEVYVNENNDTIPRWELAFSTCYDYSLRGVHMFGLWDSKSQIMRIYSYVEKLPNSQAKYCYYEVSSRDSVLFDVNTKMWQPSDSLIRTAKWYPGAITNAQARPSAASCQVLPITGTNQIGQVNGGIWLCFELDFNAMNFDKTANKDITFSLTAVQDVDINIEGSISGTMSSYGGQITIPGYKYKEDSARLLAWGSFLSDISSVISGTASAAGSGGSGGGGGGGGAAGIAKRRIDAAGGAAIATFVIGATGAALSFAGNLQNASHAADSSQYQLAINFAVKEAVSLTGNMYTTLGTDNNTITMTYGEFFKEVLKNNPPKNQASRRRANSNEDDVISLGVWNLKKQPVLYVCNDARYDASGYLTYMNSWGNLASFLDPTSIELMLNTNSALFDIENVKKVSLTACDFAFVNEKYRLDAQPYYNFYGVPQDQITDNGHYWFFPWGDDGYKMFLLDQDAEYQSSTRDGIKYTGVKCGIPASDGSDLSHYDVIYSPAIQTKGGKLNTVSVLVMVEVEFKDGDKRVFAERFLPQIKTFNMADAPALKKRFENATVPTGIDGIELENHLFDMQKAKALRMLEPLAYAVSGPYPIVYTGMDNVNTSLQNNKPIYGIRIREYQDENTPGIVIHTTEKELEYDHYPSYELMRDLGDCLMNLNDMDAINSKLERCNMFSLNEDYVTKRDGKTGHVTFNWTPEVYEVLGGLQFDQSNTENKRYILIFYEDKDGNLTLQN